MAETTGVAELVVRVKDEATKNIQKLAKVLQETLDPEQWEEVKEAMDDLGIAVEDVGESFEDLQKKSKDTGDGMDKSRKKIDKFKDNLDDVSDAADAVGGSLGGVTGQASNLLGVLTRVNPLLAGIGVAIGGATLGITAANNVATFAKELDTLSTVSNTTTQELQGFTAAANTVGFDLDKSADILKDFNDRVGDFLSTGGGALQDYFDALGDSASFTAQELENLGTTEALVAIQADLEAANLPLERQIFLWESISGEASKLIPILSENGKELENLTRIAERRGEIFTDQEIADALEFERTMRRAGEALATLWRRIGIAVIPVLEGFTETVEDVTKLVGSLNALLQEGEQSANEWADALSDAYNVLSIFSPTAQAVDQLNKAIGGAADEAERLGDAELNTLGDEFVVAEEAAKATASALAKAATAQAQLKATTQDSRATTEQQAIAAERLAELEEVIIELAKDNEEAQQKVLDIKDKIVARQKELLQVSKDINEENDPEKAGKDGEEVVETISLGLQLAINEANKQLAQMAVDTADTLEGRLNAASRSVFLEYKETLDRMKALGGDTNLVGAIISQETARAQFDILTTEFDRVGAQLERDAQKIGRQVSNGILSEADGQAALQEIYATTQEELDSLLEKMSSLAEQSGSSEMAETIADLSNETANLKQSLGEDGFIRPEWIDNLEDLRRKVNEVRTELVDLNNAGVGDLGQSLAIAAENARQPLEDLREELRKTFSGEELAQQEALIDELIPVRETEAQLDVLSNLFQAKVRELNSILASIEAQEDAGIISEAEAARQVGVAYATLRPQIAETVDAINQLGEASGLPTVQQQARDLNTQFLELDTTVKDVTASMSDNLIEAGTEAAGSGLAQAITDIAQGAEDLGDIFDNVMKGILQSMLDVVQSQTAKQLTNFLANAAASSFGGGGALAFATGGYVRGRGTTTSDSIPARLSDKEFVQPANATAYYGVQFMELLRRRAIPRELLESLMGGRALSVRTPRRANFSQGGFVSGNILSEPQGGASQGDLNVTLVQVKDDDEAKAYMMSKSGQNDLVQVLENNKTKVRQILN